MIIIIQEFRAALAKLESQCDKSGQLLVKAGGESVGTTVLRGAVLEMRGHSGRWIAEVKKGVKIDLGPCELAKQLSADYVPEKE